MRETSTPTPSLPDDPAALRALLLAAWAERDDAVAERDALVARNERLQHLLRKLQRMQFGRRSEQLTADQLQFAFAEVEASIADTEAEAEKRSPDLRKKNTARRRAGRGRLPAHLPRIEQVLLPESTACACCQGQMVEIGCDEAERLDVILVQFRALVTRRPKFACRACPGVVVQASAPARLVTRWCAAASLVETCKLNGVDPQRYFTDLLTRLVNGWPNDRIDELMPWCWAAPQEPIASAEGTKGL